MKIRKLLALAVLLALPVLVWAQVVVNDGASTRGQTGTLVVGGLQKSTDTTGRAIKVNASGQVAVDDEDRDRDLVYTWSDIIPLDSLRASASGNLHSDSSQVIQLQGARHLMLGFKGCPKYSATMASTISLVAVQIRTHINGNVDSMSTLPIQLMQSLPIYVAANGVYADTFSVGHLVLPAAGTPGSTEFVVKFSRSMCNYHNTTGNAGLASSTFPYPGGFAIPLDNLYGRDIRLSNISVRARTILGPAVDDFTVTLMGFGK